ncbi:MAG: glycosyltransferase family 2 protein [Bacteroidales bacterium]|nr:glycosyltransferase family 2 protein [Bacteroidales bacterium]
METPLISIIMPCFNAADTLEKAVQCILKQTYTHWELLILEDGSVDASLQLAGQFARADKRIQLINSAKNRGVIRMRNLGIRLAKGQWIAFCDADDWWIAEKLEMQMNLAHTSKASLLYSAVYYVRLKKQIHIKEVQLIADASFKTMLKTNAIPMSSAVYSVNSLGKHYFQQAPDNLIHEDYAYWLQLFKKRKVDAAYIRKPTTYIRLRPHSRSANLLRAARSHAIIMHREGQLPFVIIALNFVFYFFTAARKRIPWFGWKEVETV